MAYFQSPMPSREYLWEIFRKVDADHSGSISVDELQRALSNGTWKAFNPETVRLMIGMFDKSNRGQISFEDFGALWKYVTDWQNCFRSFDRDNSGNIDKDELRTALSAFGYRLSDNLVGMMVHKFDRFGQGTVLFDDFIQCCITLQNLDEVLPSFSEVTEKPLDSVKIFVFWVASFTVNGLMDQILTRHSQLLFADTTQIKAVSSLYTMSSSLQWFLISISFKII